VDTWSRRSKKITIALWLAGSCLMAALAAVIAWFLLRAILGEESQGRMVLITILCLPLPYLAYYLLCWKKGFSPLRRWRVSRALSGIPPDAPPEARARAVWDWLPLTRRLSYGGMPIGLAPREDPAWNKLADANHDAKLATGSCFDMLLLLRGGAFNFVSGDLPGAGAWLAAPAGLVEGMQGDGLRAAVVHELFHRDTGELRARRVALELRDFSTFATAFVFYYLFMVLALLSVPVNMPHSDLPQFVLLLLLLWVILKVFARWAVTWLFPGTSCRAADEYAGNVVADPSAVAEAICLSLRYTSGHKDPPFLWNWQARGPAGFMFVPVVRRRREGELQARRVEALRMGSEDDRKQVPPPIEEMNKRIGEIAGKVRDTYSGLLKRRPRRTPTVLAYSSIVVVLVAVLIMSTGKNFYPVRLVVDWRWGGANAAVAEPSGAGRTVVVCEASSHGSPDAYFFSPDYQRVTVGETVTWVNRDRREHIITGEGIPTSPVLQPGDSYSFVFNRSGEFDYYSLRESGEPGSTRGRIFAYYERGW